MKNLKIVLSALSILVAFVGCKKTDEPVSPEEPEEQYNCVFDSNVGELRNFRNPTYNIYVDSLFVGVWPNNRIDSAYFGAITDYEDITDTKVYVTLKPGKHSFKARLFCGTELFSDGDIVKGDFIVPDTGYVFVLIDINKSEVDDSIDPFVCGV